MFTNYPGLNGPIQGAFGLTVSVKNPDNNCEIGTTYLYQ